jgi:hypothetical protein
VGRSQDEAHESELSEITDHRGGFDQVKEKGTVKFENVNNIQRNRKDKDGKACMGVLNILCGEIRLKIYNDWNIGNYWILIRIQMELCFVAEYCDVKEDYQDNQCQMELLLFETSRSTMLRLRRMDIPSHIGAISMTAWSRAQNVVLSLFARREGKMSMESKDMVRLVVCQHSLIKRLL